MVKISLSLILTNEKEDGRNIVTFKFDVGSHEVMMLQEDIDLVSIYTSLTYPLMYTSP